MKPSAIALGIWGRFIFFGLVLGCIAGALYGILLFLIEGLTHSSAFDATLLFIQYGFVFGMIGGLLLGLLFGIYVGALSALLSLGRLLLNTAPLSYPYVVLNVVLSGASAALGLAIVNVTHPDLGFMSLFALPFILPAATNADSLHNGPGLLEVSIAWAILIGSFAFTGYKAARAAIHGQQDRLATPASNF
jgi:hypothetical protein